MTVTAPNPATLGDLADPRTRTEPIALGNLATEELLGFWQSMMRIRRSEEKIADLVIAKKITCPCHLAIGQEAVAVGFAKHLRASDRSYGAHRSHAHFLALGGRLDQMFAEIFGKDTGCSRGMGGSMHLTDESIGFGGSVPIVAGTVPVALGAALAFKQQGRDDVAIAFFGDGAMEEGVVQESLNMAQQMKLPIIFVVENNLFASHMDIHLRQATNCVSRFAEANNVPYVVEDGNDIVSVAAHASELIGRARAGEGPSFYEGVTYRWRGHVGPAEDIDVGLDRKADDIAAWKKRDPVGRLQESLVTERQVDPAEFEKFEVDIAEEIAAAVRFADESDFPPESALLDRVYAPLGGQQ